MAMYAETMLIPAIPNLIKDFDISYGMSSWVLTSYLIAGAVMTPIAGNLSDIYGKKRVLLIIMMIYAIGVSMAGFSTDILTLILARTIQGIGISMFPIAFGIVRDLFPREKISIGQGVITSMFAAGSVLGLSIGGVIIQDYGWRMTFFMIIPISFILLFIIRKYVHVVDNELHPENEQKKIESVPFNTERIELPNRKFSNNTLRKNDENENDNNVKYIKKKAHIDIKGALTLATTIISLLLALTFLDSNIQITSYSANNYYHAISQILPFIIVGIISLILFIIIEKRTPFPLINFKIFDTTILFSSLIIMIVGMSMFMVFQTIPILIQTPIPIGFGEDPIATGQIQLPFSIVLLIFGPASGFIISKLGTVKPLIMGSVLTTLGFIGLFLFHANVFYIAANLALLSAGLSFASVGAMNVIILAAPREYSVVTIGVSSLLRIIGSSIGPALAAMYMEINQTSLNINGNETYFPSPFAFDMIFLSAIILSIIAIILSILLSRKILKISIPNLT
jgi:MFS family permease